MKDLSGFDLNLLRVFDAVARERHVTRAAARLNLSQPAVSNALNRLRAALGDELFLRAPQGVEPTSLALALMHPVEEMLDRLQETLAATAPFDPATSDRVFTLAFSEYAEAILAPPLFARLAEEAPNILVAIRHADRTNAGALLENNEAQLAIAMLGEPTALYTRLRLLPEAFMVLARPGHPLLEGEMTAERYTGFPHLLHSPNGSRDGAIDRVLRELGHSRRLGAVVAHLSAVPGILLHTDMVMTLSGRLARQLSAAHGLVLLPLPEAVAAATKHTRLSMIFHRRFEADQGHAWLRRLLLALAREVVADCPADGKRASREAAD
ncbi:DNA-binding transcriptional regulator, LysR family [Roseomonas rosea]|uniref:DNA-binding transcriptional regulator, LysR family n=1 Tax=Muricoccus roseus TaxID=198092 RepID=A0A1M6CM00_9PROT|nr:LysR family transcriptional regulator [Roseomonas rosea]SHI62036.1 DNA-binding transcriptional regulator, LysR family [Roseomonas rosea]